ncbi:MAG: YdeI/OmpD-associated family protein [Chloroflexi bacterium]|nr:YdeI/OmpD-associated family protein [Chloroflexota bacterium]
MSPITRPSRDEVLVFNTRDDFRAWLEDHHAHEPLAWIGYYRKGAGELAMTYPEAVEEGLCYGWIDGITYRVDDEVTASRFTPRRPGSNWSAVNIERAHELIRTGRMAPPGVAAFEARDREAAAADLALSSVSDLPKPMLRRLRADAAARSFWEGRTAAYRRNATRWVLSAKREETRRRRLEQLIADSAAGRPIKLLRQGREQPG